MMVANKFFLNDKKKLQNSTEAYTFHALPYHYSTKTIVCVLLFVPTFLVILNFFNDKKYHNQLTRIS